MLINAELALLDSNGPDMQLYRAVNKKYSPDNPLGSFGQMGFVAAKMFTDTVLKLPEDQLNKEGINKAILDIKNYKTDVLCKPWYFQEMKLHVPNNTDLPSRRRTARWSRPRAAPTSPTATRT